MRQIFGLVLLVAVSVSAAYGKTQCQVPYEKLFKTPETTCRHAAPKEDMYNWDWEETPKLPLPKRHKPAAPLTPIPPPKPQRKKPPPPPPTPDNPLCTRPMIMGLGLFEDMHQWVLRESRQACSRFLFRPKYCDTEVYRNLAAMDAMVKKWHKYCRSLPASRKWYWPY